ncbi:MAG: hypothetical protein ABIW76_15480 [Fibrobacteria bacterium]
MFGWPPKSRTALSACKPLCAGLAVLLFCGCLFETETETGIPPATGESPGIRPDLSIGNQWMYRFLRYTAYENGTQDDSTRHFIHYRITGDSLIAGAAYRILVEEDLALFNTDLGLVRNRSVYAVLSGPSGLAVKALKEGDPATGRFPFKRTADAETDAGTESGTESGSNAGTDRRSGRGMDFDSVHFRDEVLAMKATLLRGLGWDYRAPGNPSGLAHMTKTYLGEDTLARSTGRIAARKFRVWTGKIGDAPTYEWYAGGVKIFSRSSASTTFEGLDSTRAEEEYLGHRGFTPDDTLAVLKGSVFDPDAE